MNPHLKQTFAERDVEASLQHEFNLCWITNNRDTSPKLEAVTLAILADRFREPDLRRGKLPLSEYLALDKADREQKKIRDAEKNGQAFIPARFSRLGTRIADDVVQTSAFVLDFDGGVTKAEIEEELAAFAYTAYTSYSHHAKEDRWRVIVPYAIPCLPEQHAAVYAYFESMFDGRLDPRSETPNQLWYTPACPPDAGNQYELLVQKGLLFNPYSVASPSSTGNLKHFISEQARSSDSRTGDDGAKPGSAGDSKGDDAKQASPMTDDERKRLVSALEYITAEDRSIWIRVGMALKHVYGDAALDIWLEWSRKSEKFDAADASYNWGSFKHRDTAVTLGTVFWLAIQGGWKPDCTNTAGLVAVAKLNESHFVSRESGKTIVFREVSEPGTRAIRLQRLTPNDVTEFYRNQSIPTQKKPVGLGTYWLGHRDRRQYTDVIFSPNVDILGTYNLWRGFAVEPAAGSWPLMKNHILEVLCGGDSQQYAYVIGWMAYAVQRPEHPAEVALVMRGLQGTGKGVVARAFGKLFGQHFLQISQSRHLTGHFNSHLMDCVVLFADEAFWAGDKQGEGALKALITEPRLVIEPKGVNAYSVKNRLHIMIASNNDWVVPAGNRERRYCVLDVSDAHIQDLPYFAALNTETEDGGLAAMLYDLMEYDLSVFDVREPPYTDGLRTQMLQTLTPQQQWWLEELQSGEIWAPDLRPARPGHPAEEIAPNSSSRSELQTKYAQGCCGLHASRSSSTQLGIFLRSVLPLGWPRESNVTQTRGKRKLYVFPRLADCRLHFEGITGLKGIFAVESEGVENNLHNLDNLKSKSKGKR